MAGSSSCGTKISKAADFLSSLPDNVFTVIFSFLTTKEAFSTCISCKKLKHLMTVIPNVECKETGNDCLTKKREFMESVSRFLENHDSLIKTFHLSFNPLGYRYRSDVCYWLSFVLKNGLEELDLVFDGSNNLMFLPSLLTAPNLKVLKLSHCVVNLPSIIGFKSLKSLLLGSMDIPESVIGLICCHCESLQHFTLEYCSGFTKIEILDPKSKLETLILNDCQTMILDNLFAPFALKISSLKTLSIRQKIINFFFVGSPHINNLILCRQAEVPVTRQESRNMKDRIIGSLGNVRTLQLAGWAFEPHTTHASHTTHAALPPSFCIAYLKLPPSSVSSELETLTYSAPPPSTAASPPPGGGTTKPRSDTKCWNY
ncbi:hypothetical protein POM88_034088 [Heracleum sosnowskyi]|uniref:F-box domain-containing protein n=1 Tax=Heracleum sosnowskyi TaxID=360622 RepID=A0AAD8MBX2_9APIA|nr:hypothetical protein POM88_034088 [Heracleum sosnowskyi]